MLPEPAGGAAAGPDAVGAGRGRWLRVHPFSHSRDSHIEDAWARERRGLLLERRGEGTRSLHGTEEQEERGCRNKWAGRREEGGCDV